ncbi:DUF3515 domain-containing protein [Mycobacterium asiaticum]|nr:DUF3515 domain-containing protein [Mycobacterium asiaticum]
MFAALALAVGTIVGILVFAATRQAPRHPVVISAIPAPQAGAPACQALIAALPQQLGKFERAAVADPAPAGVSAWRSESYTEPVVVRCGLKRPDDFVVGSPIQQVDRVQWFESAPQSGADTSTWYTVDRPVYVALTLPAGTGPAPIQDLSAVIDRTIAAVLIDPAPAR